MKDTLDTLLDIPDPGKQGGALQDLFFKTSLPSRTGDIADFPNTEKQVTILRKMRRQRNLSQRERPGQGHTIYLSQTNMSNMIDRVFKQ